MRLHQRYVVALRDGVAGGTAAELARHAHLAGDRDTALAASIRAGDEAMRVGGPDEAAHHYERALGLLAERAAPVDDELVDVVVRTCDAMNAAGKAERGAELAAEQLDRLPADAPGLWRARLLASLAEMRLAFVDGSDLLGPTEEAVAALPADAPPGVRARVQAMRSRALSVNDRYGEANVVARQALAAAEEAGADRLAAEISVNIAFTEDTGSEESFREGLAAAIDRAERAGALLPELRGRMLLGLSMLNLGELDDAAPVLAGGLARAEEQGVPWAPYAFDCRARLFQVEFMRGRWDDALALADVVGAPPILQAWLDALRLAIEQARGADVSVQLAGLRPYWTQEFEVLANAAPLEMTEAGRRGDVAGILASYDAAVAAAVPVWGEWFEARVRLAAVAIAELARALPQLPVGERAAVVDHVRRLHDDGRRVEARDRFGGDWGPEGLAWLAAARGGGAARPVAGRRRPARSGGAGRRVAGLGARRSRRSVTPTSWRGRGPPWRPSCGPVVTRPALAPSPTSRARPPTRSVRSRCSTSCGRAVRRRCGRSAAARS